MQFCILLIGALLFTFYQFQPSPVFFNRAVEQKALATSYKDSMIETNKQYNYLKQTQTQLGLSYIRTKESDSKEAIALKDSLQAGNKKLEALRNNYKGYIKNALPGADNNDTNYIFLRFVVDYMPVGLVGLLIAIIFLAAWGSIAAALNSLASCTMIDFHLRFKKVGAVVTEEEAIQYRTSKWYTLGWGVFCIIVAQFANRMGSLIEAVNILGSLFYGVILGIFLVAFYIKRIGGKAVFWAAIISEIGVVTLFLLNQYKVIGLSFLWLNVAGALFVVVLSYAIQMIAPKEVAAQDQ
jgi:uncharacterized sodium:solute symporter family permease YidK